MAFILLNTECILLHMWRVFCLFGVVSLAANAQPRFEVASVKPAQPDAEISSMNGGPLPAGPFNISGKDPGRITWTNMWLSRMIQVAYDFPADRISGPASLDTAHYDIVATVPMGTSVDDFKRMVQNLLAERFNLTVHRGAKDVSGYALEVAKNGLKITKSKDLATLTAALLDDDKKPNPKRDEAVQYMATRTQAFNALVSIDENGFPAPRPGNPYYPPGAGFEVTIVVNGRYRSTKLNASMPQIATFLGGLAGMPAQDQTGLAGIYDVHLEYLPRPSGDAPTVAADPGPDVLDAVQQQLGLKLTPQKVPVEILIVDHVEKLPTAN
jgi:uncharacterized protein (TIGR03435 family)